MTFEVWWQNITKTCELSRAAPFYSMAKMLADSAWRKGSEEGTMMTLRVLRDHEAHTDKEDRP